MSIPLGKLGDGSATVAGTTITVTNTSGSTIPAGTLLVIAGAWDNINSITAPTLTLATTGGLSWTPRLTPAIGSGVSTTAGTGLWHASWTLLITSSIANAATITTTTSNQSAVKRAATCSGFSQCTNILRGTVPSGTSGAGAPSVASAGTALVATDQVIGTVAHEDNNVPTADADTLNGSWTAMGGIATAGGAANTNVAVGIQSKVVTATGVQTYNPTGLLDSVASVFALVSGARDLADSAPATDAVTRTLSLPRPEPDSSPATDDVVADVDSGSTNIQSDVADSAPASDTQSATVTVARSVSDSAPAVDTVARTGTFTRSVSDGASATDSVTRTWSPARAAADAAAATDAVLTSLSPQTRDVSDGAPAVDTVTRTVVLARSGDDTAGGSDLPPVVMRVAWIEFETPGPIPIEYVTDSAPATDTAMGTVSAPRSAADDAPSTDTVTRAWAASPSVADTAGAADTVTQNNTRDRAVTDASGGTDVASGSAFRFFSATASDSAPATDDVEYVFTPALQFFESTADDVASATDVVERQLVLARAVSDDAPATDDAENRSDWRDLEVCLGRVYVEWDVGEPYGYWDIGSSYTLWNTGHTTLGDNCACCH